jgi:hypothetical protein
MITVWNRHEVYVGFDMKRFNQILDLLAMEKIKYKYRTINHTSRGLSTTGMNLDFSIMYYVYVHKKDADRARQLVGSQLR